MANFRTHLVYGAGVSSITSLISYFKFGLNKTQAIAGAILGTLASIAPDLDHSESTPGKLFFEILGILVPLAFIQFLPKEYVRNFKIEHWIIYLFVGYILIRYGLFYVFDILTAHRGIFHSLPAALIAGEITFLMFPHLEPKARLGISIISFVGYLTHLITDEFYSVDWENNTYKKSFGTAIDLGKPYEFSTWLAYLLIIGLGIFILKSLNIIKF